MLDLGLMFRRGRSGRGRAIVILAWAGELNILPVTDDYYLYCFIVLCSVGHHFILRTLSHTFRVCKSPAFL